MYTAIAHRGGAGPFFNFSAAARQIKSGVGRYCVLCVAPRILVFDGRWARRTAHFLMLMLTGSAGSTRLVPQGLLRMARYWLMKAEPDSRVVKGKDVKVSLAAVLTAFSDGTYLFFLTVTSSVSMTLRPSEQVRGKAFGTTRPRI